MGIAGFFLWLQRFYPNCIDDVPDPVTFGDGQEDGGVLPPPQSGPRYDNLYLDMNGLIHPCCHDTYPLPEPESEEEMFDRIFRQIDVLYNVVRPKKCLVLCIDGVAPRSKMNQQRTRRFRAAQEREENNAIANDCADYIVKEHGLPRPQFREKWDHNVITPSTAFMERVGQAIEWFCIKKVNEDPNWRHITLVFSDAHVPGEGEHKIMHYIRGLRAQQGYQSNISHCIHGMDADLICLGLSTHEPNFGVLRNKLNENFQPVQDQFCYFNLRKFREQLMKDFSNIRDMDFERIIDDFVFLCFFVGNDFLPHMPLVSIKTKGIELMLDHYVRAFEEHGYLTKKGEVRFDHLHRFLKSFLAEKIDLLKKEYDGKKRAQERAKGHMKERCDKAQKEIEELLGQVTPSSTEEERQGISNKILTLYGTIKKEELRFVAGRFPLTFSYKDFSQRNMYYECKFGWDPKDSVKFESNIRQCCAEFLRGMQWVMRYYTKGCPSWEWYYPFHYTPLLQDLAAFTDPVNVEMKIGEPLHPVEQLLAVLPRQSVGALPEELHEAVEDPKSVLAKFYPETLQVDFTEANFSYQGITQLPFINCQKLKQACAELVELEEDVGTTLLFCHRSSAAARELERLLNPKNQQASSAAVAASSGGGAASSGSTPVSAEVFRVTPIAGRVARYPNAWPLNSRIECPDSGIVSYPGSRYSSDVKDNQVCCFAYELNTHADYHQALLRKGAQENKRERSPGYSENTSKRGSGKRSRSDEADGGGQRQNRRELPPILPTPGERDRKKPRHEENRSSRDQSSSSRSSSQHGSQGDRGRGGHRDDRSSSGKDHSRGSRSHSSRY